MSDAKVYTSDEIPTEDYHAASGIGEGLYVTRSILRDWIDDPPGCYDRHVRRLEIAQQSETDALRFGRLFDSYCFEGVREPPSTWVKPPRDYVGEKAMLVGEAKKKGYGPDNLPRNGRWDAEKKRVMVSYSAPWDWKAGACQRWKREQIEAGNHIASKSDWDQWPLMHFMYEKMRDTVQGRAFLDALDAGQLECGSVVRWTCRHSGLPMQAQFDAYWPAMELLIDGKTFGLGDFDKFNDEAEKKGYHMQDAIYTEAATQAEIPVRGFLFAVWQKVYPFRARMRILPRQLRIWGEDDYMRAAIGIAKGDFSAPDDGGIEEGEIKPWQLYRRGE